MHTRLRIGVVGTGAIGATICRAIDDGTVPATLVGVCETDEARREAVLAGLTQRVPVLSLDSLAGAADVVVEAVSKALAPKVVADCLRGGADVVVMSVAGLVDRPDLIDLARECGRRIHVPTGAIAGLDGLRAAAVAGVETVTLTTTKPPRGLAGAPYVAQQGLDLESYTEPTILFEGNVREAVAAFPANVNVSAALALAGIGPERTTVRVAVDPTSDRNRHAIEIVGASGRIAIQVDNVPSPQNPKTSYLAALSAIALLQRLTAPLAVGT